MRDKTTGRRWWGITPLVVESVVLTGIAVVAMAGAAGAAAPPALTMTPGPYHNGQSINLSVGPNKYFTPYSRINIIECADPGGKASNLPTSADSCDGNTIQGTTVLVQPNGSFSERGYQLYALPNATQLGEPSDTRPVCNQRKGCVLYIGQNQEKFTAPKMFSPPLWISKSSKR
jgi:hypothetical protein